MENSPASGAPDRWEVSGRDLLLAAALVSTYVVIGIAYSVGTSTGPLGPTTAALCAGLVLVLATSVLFFGNIISRRAASLALQIELATAVLATAWFVLVSWSYSGTPHNEVSVIASVIQVSLLWIALRVHLRGPGRFGGVYVVAALVAASMVSLWIMAALNTRPNPG